MKLMAPGAIAVLPSSRLQIRNRDTGSILKEVEHLHVEHGYTGFMFYDDELNVSKSFVELMNGLSADMAIDSDRQLKILR